MKYETDSNETIYNGGEYAGHGTAWAMVERKGKTSQSETTLKVLKDLLYINQFRRATKNPRADSNVSRWRVGGKEGETGCIAFYRGQRRRWRLSRIAITFSPAE